MQDGEKQPSDRYNRIMMELDKAIALVDETLWLYLDYGDVNEDFMQAWEAIKEHLEQFRKSDKLTDTTTPLEAVYGSTYMKGDPIND